MSMLAPIEGQHALTFPRDQLELVKRTIAKDATDDELKMFLYLARQYNLDPFKKEIWFWKIGNKPTIMTSRDGYLKVAQEDPNYDGLIGGVVKEGDIFEFCPSECAVKHKFGEKRGKIIGAWAMAFHKKRRSVACFVDFAEYSQNSKDVWRNYPSAMIQKVAEAFVLKRQFAISGLVTQEEIGSPEYAETSYTPQQYQREPEVLDAQPEPPSAMQNEPAEQPQQRRKHNPPPAEQTKPEGNMTAFWASVGAMGFTDADVHAEAGVDSIKGFSQKQLNELMQKMARRKQTA